MNSELAISIVSWNTREMLRVCLHSLRRYCRQGHTRVIVIDNASKDGTPDMIRNEFPEVQLIESGGNLGFGKAHNLVRQHSNEPHILFLNPDTEFLEPSHEAMLQAMRDDPSIGAASCTLIDPDGTVNPLGIQWFPSPWTELIAQLFISRTSQRLLARVLPTHDAERDGAVKKLYGGCLMLRREVLDRVGWFDERFFMYGEDVDLSRRVYEGGYKLWHVASTRVIHLGGGASAKAPGRFAVLMQYESISKLMRKNYGALGRLVYVATAFTRALLRMTALSLVRAVRVVMRRDTTALQQSWGKQRSILRWSLGLERPSIPK